MYRKLEEDDGTNMIFKMTRDIIVDGRVVKRASDLGWERGGRGRDRTGRSGDSNAHDEKGKATGADEVRLEMMEMAGKVGVKWTGRLLNVCM